MANHLSLVHGDLIDNDCYNFLMQQWLDHKIDKWNIDDLIHEYGHIAVDEIMAERYLVLDSMRNVRLAFNVYGTICKLIVTFCANDVYTFNLLQEVFAGHECSSSSLKSYLTFMENFGIIEYIELAATGVTCIAVENTPHLIDKFDKFASLSNEFDQRCIHSMDTEIGCKSIQFLRP